MEEIKAAVFMVLLVCGLWDWKKTEIPIWICGVGAFGILGMQAYSNEMAIWEMAAGAAIGLLLLVVGKVTGQIGIGDGIVFMITGIGMGFWNNLLLLWGSLLLMATVSLALILLQKIRWKARLPFLPFVLCAYVIELMKDMG